MNTSPGRKRIEPLPRTLLRTGIELLYQRVARPYDWLTEKLYLGQWRLWQRSAIPFLQGQRILEIGTGTGNLQVDIAALGYQVWGVDYSLAMLKESARKARRHGIKQPRLCRARTQALPFPAEYFDSIVSTFGSNYLTDSQTHREAARVLRGGGKFALVAGGGLFPGSRLRAIKHWMQRKGAQSSEPLQVHQLSDEQSAQLEAEWMGLVKGLMREEGFTVSTHVAYNRLGMALMIVGDKSE